MVHFYFSILDNQNNDYNYIWFVKTKRKYYFFWYNIKIKRINNIKHIIYYVIQYTYILN